MDERSEFAYEPFEGIASLAEGEWAGYSPRPIFRDTDANHDAKIDYLIEKIGRLKRR